MSTNPEIPVNEKSFVKGKSSSSKINGSNGAYELWYDNKKWKRIPPGGINEDAEVGLQLIHGDAYAMIIFEEFEIPVLNLVDIALDNAINVAPNIKTVMKEYRVVNNDTIVCMQMQGSASGIDITYHSYYFSNENGSIQFHTFTGQSIFSKYQKDIEELLNGLVIL